MGVRQMPKSKPSGKPHFAGSGFDSGSGGSTLPTATASRLGGIKVGNGLSVQDDGTLSASGGMSISTTESKIGTYNGEDLYAISFHKDVAGSSTFNIDFDSLNVGRIVMLFGSGRYNNGYECLTIPTATSNAYDLKVTGNISSGKINRLIVSCDNTLISNIEFTMFYTKVS